MKRPKGMAVETQAPLLAPPALDSDLEAAIGALEQAMPQLQMQHGGAFAIANAWAERYDAILTFTPDAQRPAVEARLRRIGIRWGVVPGARVTTQLPTVALRRLLGTGTG